MPPVLGRGFPQRTLADLRRHASLHCSCGSFPGSRTTTRTRRRTYPTTHARVPVQGREGELDRPRGCGQNWLPGLASPPPQQRFPETEGWSTCKCRQPVETPPSSGVSSFLRRRFVPRRGPQDVVFFGCRQMPVEHSGAAAMAAYIHRHSRSARPALEGGQGSRSDRLRRPGLDALPGPIP